MPPDIILPYKKDHPASYAPGAFATIELMRARPQLLRKVYIRPSFAEKDGLAERCARLGIPALCGEEAFRRVRQKENEYVAGVFDKYADALDPGRGHVVLVSPMDMGNLGAVMRAAAGMNITDLAVVSEAADIFHPKTVRASMGALFRINCAAFESFEAYRAAFPAHACYPFMLEGDALPRVLATERNPLFALVFGNEARGLPPEYASIGRAVRIPQSHLVDSLNLSIAAGIGAYAFAEKFELI
ncbi:MAG: TrmH family RNA methyltransferase [Oscillospiraceae bacterium]|jgi:TrmH family RNA methyltransferase|nr:TrmH family RNA methyltransferase [Oscillospiraceae bacterium]